jgi:glutaredoxin
MDWIAPSLKGYTVYTKSGCPFCVKVKELLNIYGSDKLLEPKEEILVAFIDCDEYLRNDRDGFLAFIRECTGGREWKTFPMVFLDGQFLGGFTETRLYLDRAMAFSF